VGCEDEFRERRGRRRKNRLDEACSDNDTAAKVTGEEVDIDWDAHPAHASGQDGEEGGSRGAEEDDEEGGQADTLMMRGLAVWCDEEMMN